jgi:hypothetical protein
MSLNPLCGKKLGALTKRGKTLGVRSFYKMTVFAESCCGAEFKSLGHDVSRKINTGNPGFLTFSMLLKKHWELEHYFPKGWRPRKVSYVIFYLRFADYLKNCDTIRYDTYFINRIYIIKTSACRIWDDDSTIRCYSACFCFVSWLVRWAYQDPLTASYTVTVKSGNFVSELRPGCCRCCSRSRLPLIWAAFELSSKHFFSQSYVKVPHIFFLVGNS